MPTPIIWACAMGGARGGGLWEVTYSLVNSFSFQETDVLDIATVSDARTNRSAKLPKVGFSLFVVLGP